jgi:hypothetical protein
MRGSVAKTHKSFSQDRRFHCFVFVAAIEENRISQMCDVANANDIFKASVTSYGCQLWIFVSSGFR